MSSVLPDQNEVYLEAIEDRFSDFLSNVDEEDRETLSEMWSELDHEPVVTSREEMAEAYDDMEEAWDIHCITVDKRISDEIRAKEKFLLLHFGENHDND